MGKDRNDTKLLAGVAAAVLLVTAAVVFSASQLSRVDETPVVAGETARAPQKRSIAAPPATPASLPVTVELPVQLEAMETIPSDADFMVEGQRAFSGRDFRLAAAYFEAQVERSPHSSWPQYMCALSLWKSGKHSAAESAMVRSTELNPAGIKGWINLSRIRNDLGDFEAALSAARSALELESDQPQALFLEGRSLANLGRIDEALRSLEASLAQDVDNGYVQNLAGLIRLQRGDAVEAVDYLRRAVALKPSVAYVHNNLGMALERSGRMEEAAIAYRRGVTDSPENEKLAANHARLVALLPLESTVEIAESEVTREPTVVAAVVELPGVEPDSEGAQSPGGGMRQ